jgi:thymidine kinase
VPSRAVSSASEVLELAQAYKVVGIDEAQFFANDIVEVANTLANQGKRVIVAGLDMDYLGNPFGPMPQLLAIAEYVTKLHAICTHTGEMAHYSHRKTQLEGQLMLGEKDHYEPLSRRAYLEARLADTDAAGNKNT